MTRQWPMFKQHVDRGGRDRLEVKLVSVKRL